MLKYEHKTENPRVGDKIKKNNPVNCFFGFDYGNISAANK